MVRPISESALVEGLRTAGYDTRLSIEWLTAGTPLGRIHHRPYPALGLANGPSKASGVSATPALALR